MFPRPRLINQLVLAYRDDTSLRDGVLKRNKAIPAWLLDLEHQIFSGLDSIGAKKLFSLNLLQRIDVDKANDPLLLPRVLIAILNESIKHADAKGGKATERVLALLRKWRDTGVRDDAGFKDAAEHAADAAAATADAAARAAYAAAAAARAAYAVTYAATYAVYAVTYAAAAIYAATATAKAAAKNAFWLFLSKTLIEMVGVDTNTEHGHKKGF